MKYYWLVFSFLLLSSPFQPTAASSLAWTIVVHSRVYSVFAPFGRELKFWASSVLEWEVADYRETILVYYRLLYNAVLHNELSSAARYCGVLLALLLKAKGYTEALGYSLIPVLESLDWSSIRVLDWRVEEIVDWWLLYEPKSLEDLAYAYASVALSLLEKLPVNSFTRVLYTPYLRELYLASLISVVVASTYFVYKRAKMEGGLVEAEAPP